MVWPPKNSGEGGVAIILVIWPNQNSSELPRIFRFSTREMVSTPIGDMTEEKEPDVSKSRPGFHSAYSSVVGKGLANQRSN